MNIQNLLGVLAVSLCVGISFQTSWAKEPVLLGSSKDLQATSAMSLQSAVEKALTQSPRLRSAEAATAIAAGELQQAGVYPNPELGFEAENIGGSGNYGRVNQAELTAGVSQTIELGGKRSARLATAQSGQEAALLRSQAARAELVRDVSVAYADAIAAERRVALLNDKNETAAAVLHSVSERVAAAADPLFQKSKAEVSAASAVIELESARRTASKAKTALATLIGSSAASFTLDGSNFDKVFKPTVSVDLEQVAATIQSSRIADAEFRQSQAAFELERARSIPDPRVSLGVRNFRESGNNALVAGIAVPIPIFDSNSGNIAKAGALVAKADADRLAARQGAAGNLAQATEDWEIAYASIISLRDKAILAAERSYSQVRSAYGSGRFPYLEVLDAQRTLFEQRGLYVTALRDWHVAKAEIDYLITQTSQTEGPSQ